LRIHGEGELSERLKSVMTHFCRKGEKGVVSPKELKYNPLMIRGAYSYWFRFWYPPT